MKLLGKHTQKTNKVIWLDAKTRRTRTIGELIETVQVRKALCKAIPQKCVVAIDTQQGDWQTLCSILGVMSARRVALPLCDFNEAQLRELGVAASLTSDQVGQVQFKVLETQPVPAPGAVLILRTSGSSGTPRHVVLGSWGILQNIDAILSYLPVIESTKVGLLTPLHYSYGLIGQCMTALRAGATLVELSRGPWIARQVEQMRTTEVEVLSAVPSVLTSLTRTADQKRLPALKVLASAGAPLPSNLVEALEQQFPETTLYNQYGMTEASPRICAGKVNRSSYTSGFVGKPLPGIELFIKPAFHNAPDAPGELFVRTPSAMLGYWQAPQASQRLLTQNGLATGDLGRLDEQGNLYICGRADDLVKIGAERISLIGVQDAIMSIPGVESCAICPQENPRFGTQLIAFVVAPGFEENKLKREFRETLPSIACPQELYLLETLPLSKNGKLDGQQLKRFVHQQTYGREVSS